MDECPVRGVPPAGRGEIVIVIAAGSNATSVLPS